MDVNAGTFPIDFKMNGKHVNPFKGPEQGFPISHGDGEIIAHSNATKLDMSVTRIYDGIGYDGMADVRIKGTKRTQITRTGFMHLRVVNRVTIK